MLVDNIKHWYKMWSVWLLSLAIFLEFLNMSWTEYSEFIPDEYQKVMRMILTTGTLAARFVKQKNLHEKEVVPRPEKG